jgi:hypothetical protein
MSDDEIDFDDIKWGSFTNQFEAYNRTAKKKMKDLSAFARMILDAPKDKFSDTTRKRANFYLNVLAKKGESKGGARTLRITPEWIQRMYNLEIPDRRMYDDEIRYVRRLLTGTPLPTNVRSVRELIPRNMRLYSAFQRIYDTLERHYNRRDGVYFGSILENWKKNTGIPLKIRRGVSYETPPPTDVVDLTTPEVIDLTGGGKIRPHIVRPFFAM